MLGVDSLERDIAHRIPALYGKNQALKDSVKKEESLSRICTLGIIKLIAWKNTKDLSIELK